MNLAEALQEKLANWQSSGEGRHVTDLRLPEYGWTVQVTAERVDSVGCVLRRLDVRRDAPLPDNAAELESHARTVAKRVTGLLEALRVVETDRTRNIAMLRSDVPSATGDAALYYEVVMTGRNHVSVQRFQASKLSPAKKEAIAFALTHEVIAKLVNDLVRD